MEVDELSNDSTIGYLTDNESTIIFDEQDLTYIPKVPEIEPKIDNIITSANLGNNLNLKDIALKIKDAEYNSNKSSTITIKTKGKKISLSIFSNGKMICSGAKSEKESKIACEKFSKILRKLNINVEIKNFKIQNIIASYNTKFKISLSTLYNNLNFMNTKKDEINKNYCKYNKENFPGLIYFINESKISIVVFESGRIIISGPKKRKELNDILKNIYPFLVESRKINDSEEE